MLNHLTARGGERRGCGGGVCGGAGDGDDARCRSDANANANGNGQYVQHAQHAQHAPLARVWPLGVAASFAPLYKLHTTTKKKKVLAIRTLLLERLERANWVFSDLFIT